jgi:hypothetical protein
LPCGEDRSRVNYHIDRDAAAAVVGHPAGARQTGGWPPARTRRPCPLRHRVPPSADGAPLCAKKFLGESIFLSAMKFFKKSLFHFQNFFIINMHL